MPTFKFHCDRGVPGTSCIPMLAALGAASLGFEVTYGRTDPGRSPAGPVNMMPDFLAGVDVVRQTQDDASAGRPKLRALRTAEGSGDLRILRILDAPLAAPGAANGYGGGSVDCLVAGSVQLSLRARDPAPLRLAYDAICRNRLRRAWDAASSSWRLDVPTLTEAEIASLLRGAPMPRPRAVADELARAILASFAVPSLPLRTQAWPMASRRLREVRPTFLPTATAR